MVNGESSSLGFQNLTQISSMVQEEAEGNVHSGASPPRFDATEENPLNVRPKPRLGTNNLASSSLNKSGKFQKLNPKRVGAAWVEKINTELEIKKKGEIVTNNFGGVWQSGSRKESRKEFEVENKSSPRVEIQSEMLIKIQPYISKRMMQVNDAFGGDHVKRITNGLDFESLDP